MSEKKTLITGAPFWFFFGRDRCWFPKTGAVTGRTFHWEFLSLGNLIILVSRWRWLSLRPFSGLLFRCTPDSDSHQTDRSLSRRCLTLLSSPLCQNKYCVVAISISPELAFGSRSLNLRREKNTFFFCLNRKDSGRRGKASALLRTVR